MEDPVLGSWPDEVDSPTVSQTMPFWPTVIAYPGYTVSSRAAIPVQQSLPLQLASPLRNHLAATPRHAYTYTHTYRLCS